MLNMKKINQRSSLINTFINVILYIVLVLFDNMLYLVWIKIVFRLGAGGRHYCGNIHYH